MTQQRRWRGSWRRYSCNCGCVAVRIEESLWEGSDEKWEEAPRDRGESQRAAAGWTENWGGRGKSGGWGEWWPVASPTAPSAERRFLCNALSVWVSKRWTILLQRARSRTQELFFSPLLLDEFLSSPLRASAGWQMYKTNRFINSQKKKMHEDVRNGTGIKAKKKKKNPKHSNRFKTPRQLTNSHHLTGRPKTFFQTSSLPHWPLVFNRMTQNDLCHTKQSHSCTICV